MLQIARPTRHSRISTVQVALSACPLSEVDVLVDVVDEDAARRPQVSIVRYGLPIFDHDVFLEGVRFGDDVNILMEVG